MFDIARKSQVYTLIQSISIHFDRVRSMALATVKNQKIVEDHEGLIRCIERGQAQQARALMEKHLNRYKILMRRKSGPLTPNILNKMGIDAPYAVRLRRSREGQTAALC